MMYHSRDKKERAYLIAGGGEGRRVCLLVVNQYTRHELRLGRVKEKEKVRRQ